MTADRFLARYLPPAAWLAAVALFAQRFAINYRDGGLWFDELFSLWASDPAASLWTMQIDKLACETNPPLHYWLLYAAQMLIRDGRTAGLVLNGLIVAATLSGLLWLARRAGRPALGWWLGVLYLGAGATVALVQDVRPYCLAIALCALVAAQLSLLRRAEAVSRSDTVIAMVLAALAGITHVYAALFVFCLAAALVLEGIVRQSGPLWRRGLVRLAVLSGGACALTFGLWGIGLVRNTGRHPPSIAWIRFDYASVAETFVRDSLLQVGPAVALAFFGLGLVLAFAARRARGGLYVAAVTAFLFFGLPLLISVVRPIVNERYYPVAGPALLILLAFAALETWQADHLRPSWQNRAALGGLSLALALPLVCGGMASRAWLAQKPVWRGADIIRAEAGNCPEKSVRAVPPPWATEWALYQGYAHILSGSGLVVEDSRDQRRDVSDIDCSVVAWSEATHLPADWPLRLGEAERLKVLNLSNRNKVPLTVRAHLEGYVVLKGHRS